MVTACHKSVAVVVVVVVVVTVVVAALIEARAVKLTC